MPGATAKAGFIDPLSRSNNADGSILCRLRWVGKGMSASLSLLAVCSNTASSRRLASTPFPAHRKAISLQTEPVGVLARGVRGRRMLGDDQPAEFYCGRRRLCRVDDASSCVCAGCGEEAEYRFDSCG